MTPEELVAYLERLAKAAEDVPATMEAEASKVARQVRAPGVGVAVGRTGDGIIVRVLSVNPRASSAQVAARIRRPLIDSVRKGIEGCIRA